MTAVLQTGSQRLTEKFGEAKMVGVDWPVISATNDDGLVDGVRKNGRQTIGQTMRKRKGPVM